MLDVALSILALIAGGLTLELFTSSLPPFSHRTNPLMPEVQGGGWLEEVEAGNPS